MKAKTFRSLKNMCQLATMWATAALQIVCHLQQKKNIQSGTLFYDLVQRWKLGKAPSVEFCVMVIHAQYSVHERLHISFRSRRTVFFNENVNFHIQLYTCQPRTRRSTTRLLLSLEIDLRSIYKQSTEPIFSDRKRWGIMAHCVEHSNTLRVRTAPLTQ